MIVVLILRSAALLIVIVTMVRPAFAVYRAVCVLCFDFYSLFFLRSFFCFSLCCQHALDYVSCVYESLRFDCVLCTAV